MIMRIVGTQIAISIICSFSFLIGCPSKQELIVEGKVRSYVVKKSPHGTRRQSKGEPKGFGALLQTFSSEDEIADVGTSWR